MKISLLTIGNELLDGYVIDTNSHFIENELLTLGLSLESKMTVRDRETEILDALSFFSQKSDIILVTGGLGPTEDDKTRACVAKFLNKKLIFDPKIFADLEAKFKRMKFPMPKENNKQAMVIEDSVILPNTSGTAPGFIAGEQLKIVAFPGVPSELKAMFATFLETLKKSDQIQKNLVSVFVKTIGSAESAIDQRLKEKPHPDITVGTVAHFGQIDIRLDIMNHDETGAQNFAKEWMSQFPDILKKVFSYRREDTIESVVMGLLQQQRKTVIVVESCTGGLLSKTLTDHSGASESFLGGLVTYHNDIKTRLLNIKADTLSQYGAVSFETTREMLMGLKSISKADYYVAVTGIAGPSGGSAEKPVGTVFIGFEKKGKRALLKFRFSGSRGRVRERTVLRVLEMLWEDLVYGRPDYLGYYSLEDSIIENVD